MAHKILVVDDDLSIRDMMSEWLEHAGYEAHTASDGYEGLKMLSELQPDLVITDVWMPGMDGYLFSSMARRTSNAAIIMMTGVANEAAVLRDMNLDIDAYKIKPFDAKGLMKRIETILQHPRAAI